MDRLVDVFIFIADACCLLRNCVQYSYHVMVFSPFPNCSISFGKTNADPNTQTAMILLNAFAHTHTADVANNNLLIDTLVDDDDDNNNNEMNAMCFKERNQFKIFRWGWQNISKRMRRRSEWMMGGAFLRRFTDYESSKEKKLMKSWKHRLIENKNQFLLYFRRWMNARSSTPLIRINNTRHTHLLVAVFMTCRNLAVHIISLAKLVM